jgi:hypothetical protein
MTESNQNEAQQAEQVAEKVAEVFNPLLEKLKKKMPGATFRLPSRGLFYRDGELDSEVDNGEVVVYPMNTLNELHMRSPDMLFQGTAVMETIRNCVPQVLKPEKLIASDVDFLLTCLRKVSYGPVLPITHKCRFCDAAPKEHEISIDQFINGAKEITEEIYEKMTVTVDDYAIRLKPCLYLEMVKLLQLSTTVDLDTAEQVSEMLDTTLLSIIRSVDGIKDKDMILQWLQKMPRQLKEDLSAKVESINQWGVEFTYSVTCPKCNKPAEHATSLNPTSFFTLPSRAKTE